MLALESQSSRGASQNIDRGRVYEQDAPLFFDPNDLL